MALLEGSQVHHQKQGGLAPGNAGGDLLGGAVGGPAAGTINTGGSSGDAGSYPLFPLRVIPVPPELTGSPFAGKVVDLDYRCKVPHGWQRCLNLKTGNIFFKDQLSGGDEEDEDEMSRSGKTPKLDLRLNLSTHHHHRRGSSSEAPAGRRAAGGNSHRSISPNISSSSSSSSSSPSSCLSSETEQGRFASSPEATSSMVLVGCPRCLMYVMLSEDDPRCPKCKSTVLLDFLRDPTWNPAAANTTKKSRKN